MTKLFLLLAVTKDKKRHEIPGPSIGWKNVAILEFFSTSQKRWTKVVFPTNDDDNTGIFFRHSSDKKAESEIPSNSICNSEKVTVKKNK